MLPRLNSTLELAELAIFQFKIPGARGAGEHPEPDLRCQKFPREASLPTLVRRTRQFSVKMKQAHTHKHKYQITKQS